MPTYPKPVIVPVWGETNTTAADMIQPSNDYLQVGWPFSTTPPSRQFFNWFFNWVSDGMRYFMQRGLPDFDLAETYSIGSCVIGDDNATYRSLQANNTGNTPSTTPAFWTPWALTIAQVNAATLTQATQAAGSSNANVANTNFVTLAIAPAIAAANTAQGAANAANAAVAAIALVATESAPAHAFATDYVAAYPLFVCVVGERTGGAGDSKIDLYLNGTIVDSMTTTSTVVGATLSVRYIVPQGATYRVSGSGIGGSTPVIVVQSWTEVTLAV